MKVFLEYDGGLPKVKNTVYLCMYAVFILHFKHQVGQKSSRKGCQANVILSGLSLGILCTQNLFSCNHCPILQLLSTKCG